jgi:hypothetical protein
MRLLFEARYCGFAFQLAASRKNFRESIFPSLDILRGVVPLDPCFSILHFLVFKSILEFLAGFRMAQSDFVLVVADFSSQCRER